MSFGLSRCVYSVPLVTVHHFDYKSDNVIKENGVQIVVAIFICYTSISSAKGFCMKNIVSYPMMALRYPEFSSVCYYPDGPYTKCKMTKLGRTRLLLEVLH